MSGPKNDGERFDERARLYAAAFAYEDAHLNVVQAQDEMRRLETARDNARSEFLAVAHRVLGPVIPETFKNFRDASEAERAVIANSVLEVIEALDGGARGRE